MKALLPFLLLVPSVLLAQPVKKTTLTTNSPAVTGTAGQVLTRTTGGISWSNSSGSASVGGANMMLEWNQNGSLAGTTNLIWDSTNNALSLTGTFNVQTNYFTNLISGTLASTLAYFDSGGVIVAQPTTITPQFARLGLGVAADSAHKVEGNLGTVTTDTRFLDLSGTWNASGTTFKGIVMNVTNTASAAGSLFVDYQLTGTSKFKVDKNGLVTAVGGGTFTGGSVTADTITSAGNVSAAVRLGVRNSLVQIDAGADGEMILYNSGFTGFVGIDGGGSSATFPRLARVNAGWAVTGGDGTYNNTNNFTLPGDFACSNNTYFAGTINATASTGMTINRSAGRVKISSGSQTYLLTNSIATANSIVLATVATDDATAVSCKAIPSSGLVTLKLNGVAAADCLISWFIVAP